MSLAEESPSTMLRTSARLSDQEPLSDEQIQHLLKDAQRRLNRDGDGFSAEPSSGSLGRPSKIPSSLSIPRLRTATLSKPYIRFSGDVARLEPTRLIDRPDKEQSAKPRSLEDPVLNENPSKKKHTKATAGPDWFDLPRTVLTPELKRDLQLIQQRSVLDPKRHYKKETSKSTAPQFSQVGTVVEGPTEFYSARLLHRERKRTLVEEVLAGEKSTGRFKRRYDDIQAARTSGKRTHYKKLKARRSGRKFS